MEDRGKDLLPDAIEENKVVPIDQESLPSPSSSLWRLIPGAIFVLVGLTVFTLVVVTVDSHQRNLLLGRIDLGNTPLEGMGGRLTRRTGPVIPLSAAVLSATILRAGGQNNEHKRGRYRQHESTEPHYSLLAPETLDGLRQPVCRWPIATRSSGTPAAASMLPVPAAGRTPTVIAEIESPCTHLS